MYKVMFVCLGNICRSPAAHGVFEDMVQKEGLSALVHVESSGTGAYHEGEKPDARMRQTASSYGVKLTHRARMFRTSDLQEYSLILAMDNANLRHLRSMCRSAEEREKVRLFRDFDPEGPGEVPDPWYGGMDGFEKVWYMVIRTCRCLLDYVKENAVQQ